MPVDVRHSRSEAGHGLRGAPGTALLLHALLSILLQFGWYLLPDGMWGIDKHGLTGYVLAIVAMQGLCILLPSLLAIGLHGLPGSLVVGRGPAGPATMLLSITLGVPAAVMLLSLNNAAVYLIARSGLALPLPILPVEYSAKGLPVLLLVALASGLLPALLEELMFRGVMQSSMMAVGGRLSAVWLTAVSFAVFHSNPLFLVAPLGAGFILGYLRLHTDSLYPCIAAHLSLNLTILLIQPLLPQLSASYLARYALTAEPVLYASLAAFFLSAAVTIPLTLLLGAPGRHRKNTRSRTIAYPADGKYLLATLLLVATIVVVYFAYTQV
jgi:membrane protease YdiL (CAAX protease family)